MSQYATSDRIGRFQIASMVIRDSAEVVRKVMGECVILRCEFLGAQDCYEYVALHQSFSEVPKSQVPPLYTVVVHQDQDGVVSIEFVSAEDIISRSLAENAKLAGFLRMFMKCAYPVSPIINPKGYAWSEAYLDELLPQVQEAIPNEK